MPRDRFWMERAAATSRAEEGADMALEAGAGLVWLWRGCLGAGQLYSLPPFVPGRPTPAERPHAPLRRRLGDGVLPRGCLGVPGPGISMLIWVQ